MSRKYDPRITAQEVQNARGAWYAAHVEAAAIVALLPKAKAVAYTRALSFFEKPRMTVFGGMNEDYWTPDALKMANRYGLDVWLMNHWYFNWDEFQKLWKNLPEPVELYTPTCVQLGELSLLSTDKIQFPPI